MVGVVIGAYRELHGGPKGVVPALIVIIVAAAGILLLFAWRRHFARDPAMVPAAILTVCALFCYSALPEYVGLERGSIGRDSSWLTLSLGLLASIVFYSLASIPAYFVYCGSRSFLYAVFIPLRPKTENATSK